MKSIHKLNIFLFLLAVFSCGLSFFILPKKTISFSEKRTLASLPKLHWNNYVNGKWSDSIDQYVNDQSPFRFKMVKLASSINYYRGIHLANREKVMVVAKPQKPTDTKIVTSDSISRKTNTEEVFEEAYSGNMLIINGSVFTLNRGNPKMASMFGKMLSKYALELTGKTRVISCVPPLSCAYIPSPKYNDYKLKNKETLLSIKQSLSNGALFCDVQDELNKHTDEKLFFSTDHHWTARGAYYAYVAFCHGVGLEPVPLDNMERRVKYDFLGSLYQLTRDKSVENNPDSMEYFIPRVQTNAIHYGPSDFSKPLKGSVFCHGCSGGNSYSTFLCGDIPLVKIKTNIKNGKKVLVIKNSMGNAFTVYLVNHYEEVYAVDFRYAQHNLLTLIKQNAINDMVFALGLHGAMAYGTIQRMHDLGFNNELVRKKDAALKDTILQINSSATSTMPSK